MFSFLQLGRLHDEDCNQDVFTKLSDQVKSDFCKSIVSISLCNGDYNATVVFLVFQQIYILKHYQLNDPSELQSSVGDITLFSCSGMAIGHDGYRRSRFLTSASLVRAFDGKTNEHYYDLKVGSDIHPFTSLFASDHCVTISCIIIVL